MLIYPPIRPARARVYNKTKQLFIDSYNKRKADNQLDVAECHLEAGAGSEYALAKGDTIGATITDRADVYVRPGATKEGLGAVAAAAAATVAAAAAADAKSAAAKGAEELLAPTNSVLCCLWVHFPVKTRWC